MKQPILFQKDVDIVLGGNFTTWNGRRYLPLIQYVRQCIFDLYDVRRSYYCIWWSIVFERHAIPLPTTVPTKFTLPEDTQLANFTIGLSTRHSSVFYTTIAWAHFLKGDKCPFGEDLHFSRHYSSKQWPQDDIEWSPDGKSVTKEATTLRMLRGESKRYIQNIECHRRNVASLCHSWSTRTL